MAEDRHRPYHHGNLREALLRAAGEMIEARGVQGLTLRELGRDLGVSHTSAQRHFTDRQALLDALAERGFEQFGAGLEAAIAHPGLGFEQRLTRLAHAHVGFALRHPALLRWMLEAPNRPDAPAFLREASRKAFDRATTIFEDGQAAGEVVQGDPQYLGLAGFAAVQGLIAVSTNGKFNGAALDDLAGPVIERIILGLRPRS